MARTSDTDRRVGRKLVAAMQVRLTPEQSAAIEARAEARELSASEALRELLDLGQLLAHAEEAGWRVSHGAMALLSGSGGDDGVVVRIAPDPDDAAGPTWMVTPEEVAAYEDRA